METAMSSNPMRCTLVGGAVVALVVLISPVTLAAEPTEAVPDVAPVVVAQAAAPATDSRAAGMTLDEYPAYQRGVRKAAAEGTEALRRYTWRTRMIYNFYYNDFAPRE
jgi:hypothetical protein